MARLTSLITLVIVTSIVMMLFYRVISVFLLPLFLAAVTVLLLRPLYERVLRFSRGHRYVAAGIMTLAVLLAAMIPFGIVLVIAGYEARLLLEQVTNGDIRRQLDQARTSAGLNYPMATECRFIASSLRQLQTESRQGALARGDAAALARVNEEWNRLAEQSGDRRPASLNPAMERVHRSMADTVSAIPGTLAYQIAINRAADSFRGYQTELLGGPWIQLFRELANPDPADLSNWSELLPVLTPGHYASLGEVTSGVIGKVVFGVLIFIVALVFWFADGPRIVQSFMTLSPLDDRYEQQLLKEFETLVRAVVAGGIVSAIAQALLAGIGYSIAGMHSVFLLMALTGVMAMVPFVGASLVWFPVGLWLFLGEGRPVAAVVLVIYGLAVISTIDNVIRPWILLEQASLHPLAALIGVLGGVQGLGPAGVFIGPIVVAFLQTLLTILHRESVEIDGLNSPLPAIHRASPGS